MRSGLYRLIGFLLVGSVAIGLNYALYRVGVPTALCVIMATAQIAGVTLLMGAPQDINA